jgi:UDP-glucose 4-epimerase
VALTVEPRRIAVTGGAGFIGSHTVEALAAGGARVLVLDDLSHAAPATLPSAAELEITDCGSDHAAGLLRRFQPDAVLHLAARGGVNRAMSDPGAHLRTAVASSVALFKAAVDAGARTIVTASSGGAVYGDAPTLPAGEQLSPRPRSAYGASKAAEELYLASFRRLNPGVNTLALRYGNVYGPRQDGTGEAGVVAITCTRLLDDRPAVIRGDGEQTRDFVYVLDVVAANLQALRSTYSGAINVGTGSETSVATVVRTLAALHGRNTSPQHDSPNPGEVRRGCLATDRARRWLDWHAATGIDEGLRHTWDWFAAHPAEVQRVSAG